VILLGTGLPFVLQAQDYNYAIENAEDQRPNILLISTDQLYAGALSVAGNPHVETPAIDSIAMNGVMFTKAYAALPLCTPSRSSFMTGLMPFQNGVRYNGPSSTLVGDCGARALQAAGYRTGYVGKWHLPRGIEDKEWSGFEYTAFIENRGVDTFVPGAVRTFLETESDQPFFLVASFTNPWDIQIWGYNLNGNSLALPNGDIGTPPSVEECPPLPYNFSIPENEPSAVRTALAQGSENNFPTKEWGPEDEEKWRNYIWGYYRFVERVDGHIGEILADLERLGLMENTVIIFISDHGEGMAAHQWGRKKIHYDESARIPFIVSWKGRTLANLENNDRLVNLGLDLFPTIYEFAGIDQPGYMMGLGARAQAMGEAPAAGHDYIVSEIILQLVGDQLSPYRARMVRSQHYKYTIYNIGSHKEQLIDMDNDPGETTSLVYDPAYKFILNEHRRMLDDWVRRTGDPWGFFSGNTEEDTDILGGADSVDGWRDSWRYGSYYAATWPWIFKLLAGWQYVADTVSSEDISYIYDWENASWRAISKDFPYYYYDYSLAEWKGISFPW
jgi:choline-sulfatase